MCGEVLKSVGFGRNLWTCLYCTAAGNHELLSGRKPAHYSSAAYSKFRERLKELRGQEHPPTCDDAIEVLGKRPGT